jgi:hypothetical protein
MRLIGLVLALGLTLAPLTIEAQQAGRVYRVGFIVTTTPVAGIMSNPTHPLHSFLSAMRDLGYVEGHRRDKGPLDETSLLRNPALPRDRTAEATGSCRSAPRYRPTRATIAHCPQERRSTRGVLSPYPPQGWYSDHPESSSLSTKPGQLQA